MTDQGFKPQNYRIFRRVTAKRIIAVEDALQFRKIRWNLVEYAKGAGVQKQVVHYMDDQTCALLAHDILHHDPTGSHVTWWNGFNEYKGTRRGDDLEARTFKIEIVEANNPVKITISNGPGEPVGPNGAIKPAKGPTPTTVAVLLPWPAARSMALAILMHLQAWQTMTYYPRINDETWTPPEDPKVDKVTGEVLGPRRAIPPSERNSPN